jgi:hypothetical protein
MKDGAGRLDLIMVILRCPCEHAMALPGEHGDEAQRGADMTAQADVQHRNGRGRPEP